MNYPQQQFNVLTEAIKKFAVHFDVKEINPNTLHYIIFQQFSEGQKHNWLYCFNGEIKRHHQINDLSNWDKFFSLDFQFELYPDNCNDKNVEVAVNKAIKILGIN